jgi:hypothetical protein
MTVRFPIPHRKEAFTPTKGVDPSSADWRVMAALVAQARLVELRIETALYT